MTTDRAGNLVIVDTHNERVRVVAVRSGTFYGQHMTAGDIYTIAGNGLAGFAGDGGPATVAEFNEPQAVAVDFTGNVVIDDTNFGGAPADQGNNRVRVVAARTGTFYSVPMTAGDIYTVGGNGQPGFAGDGGPATKAELDAPIGVSVTGAGNLLVADVNDGRVREITREPGQRLVFRQARRRVGLAERHPGVGYHLRVNSHWHVVLPPPCA
jgi:hypothetical protein